MVVEEMPVVESSGVARVPGHAGVYLTHGDRGDPAVLYAFDETGAYLGEQVVRGAENEDWEDLANGPCPASVDAEACLWIADVGDNDGERAEVRLYVVPATLDAGVDAVACPLSFPDGPEDAEALLVHPDGTVRLVTKDDGGEADVYRVRPRCDGATEVLEHEAEIELDGAVTGGAVSAAGDRVVLRTYTGAWTWEGCRLDWSAPPERVDLGSEAQGEAVAFTEDGGLVTTSEGAPLRFRVLPCAEPVEATCPACGCRTGGGLATWPAWLLAAWSGCRRRRACSSPSG